MSKWTKPASVLQYRVPAGDTARRRGGAPRLARPDRSARPAERTHRVPSVILRLLIAVLVLCVIGPGAAPAWAQTPAAPIVVEEEESVDQAPPAAAPAPARRTRPVRAEPDPEPEPETDPTELAPLPANEPDSAPAAAADPAAALLELSMRQIVLPTESDQTVVARWQRRLEHLAARDVKRAEEELREVERIRTVLGLQNLFSVSASLVREANAALSSDAAPEALTRCKEAARLSPMLPAAHWCVARATLAADWTRVGDAVAAARDAVKATWTDVRARRHAVADAAMLSVVGLLVASGLLLVLLVLRYVGPFFHDFHHLFPRGVSRWQTAFVAAMLLALPALLGAGALGVAAVALVAVSLSLTRAEAATAAVALVLVTAGHASLGPLMRLGTLGPVTEDVYALERGEAPQVAAHRLQRRIDSGLDDPTVLAAMGRYHKRLGQLDRAQAALDRALEKKKSAAQLNNLGNVKFLQGDLPAAKHAYLQANQADAALAAPLWNVALAYNREGKLELGQQAREAARNLDPERAARMGVQDDLRANLYLADVPLTDEELTALADREARAASGTGVAIEWVSGQLGTTAAAALTVLTAVLLVAAQRVRRRVRASSKCEKCGRPVCARCDPELGTTVGMCGQCISVFVRRTGVDAPDRVRKEGEVRRYRRRLKVMTRSLALIAGGGHVFAGRLLAGTLFLLLFGLIVARAAFPDGLIAAPVALTPASSLVTTGLLALAAAAVWALSLRHLLRHEDGD